MWFTSKAVSENALMVNPISSDTGLFLLLPQRFYTRVGISNMNKNLALGLR